MGLNFKTNLLPSSNNTYALGSNTQQWILYGTLNGTATNAIYSSSANYANSSNCASHAIHAGSATYANSANYASYATTAGLDNISNAIASTEFVSNFLNQINLPSMTATYSSFQSASEGSTFQVDKDGFYYLTLNPQTSSFMDFAISYKGNIIIRVTTQNGASYGGLVFLRVGTYTIYIKTNVRYGFLWK